MHALAAITSLCLAGPPVDPGLTITWQTNDAEPVTFEPVGIYKPDLDAWCYIGFATDIGNTGVTIDYNLVADVTVEAVGPFAVGTIVAGNVTIESPFLQTVIQHVTISVPSTEMPAGTIASASASVTLVTNADGGSIIALPGGAVWTGLVDGGAAFAAFPYPFIMELDHIGIIGASYALPLPEPAPPVAESVGIQLEFELTGKDRFSMTSVFFVATLLGDLDGDRTVGIEDFYTLLDAWGPCPNPCPPSCAADLDGDCNVGISDFLTLLANWTL